MATKRPPVKKVAIPDKPADEGIEQIVRRVKHDLLWVLVSVFVSLGLGLIAGQLIKF